MHLSPVSTPDGRPIWSFGGSQAYRTFEHRGFIVSLEWVGEGRNAKACMCIWAATRLTVAGQNDDAGTWVISRRDITNFVGFNRDGHCTGGASDYCYQEAREALPILGKDRNDKNAFLALVDCVIKFAPDLVHMPATPRSIRFANRNPMWEMTVTDKNSGRVLRESEV